MACTIPDIAAWFGVDEKTIDRGFKSPRLFSYRVGDDRTDRTGTLREIWTRGQAICRISLRRKLMAQADDKPAVAIFMAKNLLGYKDVPDEPAANQVSELVTKIEYGWVPRKESSEKSNTSRSPASSDSTSVAPGSRGCPVQ